MKIIGNLISNHLTALVKGRRFLFSLAHTWLGCGVLFACPTLSSPSPSSLLQGGEIMQINRSAYFAQRFTYCSADNIFGMPNRCEGEISVCSTSKVCVLSN